MTKILINETPMFNGENGQNFILWRHRMESSLSRNRTSCLWALRTRTGERPRSVVTAVLEKNPEDYEGCIEALMKAYTNATTPLEVLRSIVQKEGENTVFFMIRVREAAACIGLKLEDEQSNDRQIIIDHIINAGLREELRTYVVSKISVKNAKDRSAVSIDDIERWARAAEALKHTPAPVCAAAAAVGDAHEPRSNDNRQASFPSNGYGRGRSNYATNERGGGTGGRGRGRGRDSGSADEPTPRCNLCLRKGHTVEDCYQLNAARDYISCKRQSDQAQQRGQSSSNQRDQRRGASYGPSVRSTRVNDEDDNSNDHEREDHDNSRQHGAASNRNAVQKNG